MSYDIEILRLSGTGDPLKEAREVREALTTRYEQGLGPKPNAEEDDRRAKLTADLVALHPSLRIDPFDRGLSYGCVVYSEDPDCAVPDIFVGIEDATVSFSYSADHSRIFPELRRVIAVFEQHGYVAYDPQTDRLLSSSAEPSASSFLATRSAVIASMEARGETVIGWSPMAPNSRRRTHSFLAGIVVLLLGSLAVLAIKEIVFRPRGELILRSERARLPSRAFGSHQPSATGAAWHRGRALKKTAKCKQAGIAQAARKADVQGGSGRSIQARRSALSPPKRTSR